VAAPESQVADAFIELGLPGLAAYLAIHLCLIWEALRLTRRLRDARLRAFAAGIGACALATLLADFGTEFGRTVSVYYWYLAGLLLAVRQSGVVAPVWRSTGCAGARARQLTEEVRQA
jgi:O-antigen ligase